MLARPAKLLLVTLFLGAIWLPPLLTMLGPIETISEAEKRRLAPLPKRPPDLRSLKEFPRQFEAFYDDHFGLRRPLVRWLNRLRVTWLGVSPTEWVLVGDKGWLYQGGGPHIRDMRNSWPFGPGELAQWANVLTEKRDWLAARGIHYLFVVAPNKHLIYPEHLPAAINRVSKQSRVDQLVAHLTAHTTVTVLDLRPPLLRAKRWRQAYDKTDTHWNAFGGYIGYRAIQGRLATWLPGARELELPMTAFVVRRRPGGDLAQNLDMRDILEEPSVELNHPIADCVVTAGIPPDADNVIRNSRAFSTRCERAQYRLLMFRDSYAVELMPYLSESFAYVYYVPATPVPLSSIQELVREHQPDVVIEQRASRWLRTPQG